MATLHALALLLAFQLIGEVAAHALRLPVGPVVGLALLLASLLGASKATIASLAAKSVTTPVAMGSREELRITI